MRNNAKHGSKLEYEEMFHGWSGTEKLRRFFTLRRQKLFKHFSQQPYHQALSFEVLDEYLKTLDKFLMLEGKVIAGFKVEEHFEECKGALSFDRFYESFQKWGVSQKEISYDELSVVEKNPAFMAL